METISSDSWNDYLAGKNSTVILPAGYAMKTFQEVWIVGQRSDVSGETEQWTFSGVFSSREKAVAACRDWTYFIGACTVDDQAPHEPTPDWLRGACYPIERPSDE